MDSLPSNDRSTKKALGISAGLHVALFAAVLFTSLLSPPPPPIPHTIFVRTVSLKPGPSVRTAAALKTQASGPQTSAPKEPGPPPGPAPGPDEKIIAEEETEPSDEPTSPKKAEEPSVEKPSAPAKKATPAKTPVKASTAVKSPSHSSGTSSPSKKPSPNTQSKTTQGKGKPAPKGSSSTQKSSGTKPSGPQYDQSLLNDALRRLDRSKSTAAHGGGSGSGSSSGGVSQVGTVGALNVDSGVAVGEDKGDDGCDGYASASPEACYIGDLIRRLQLNVRLPEPGDVRVKLTLKKTGAITAVLVLSGSTASIKQAIEKKLKTVHFSPFGTSFSGESEHTFNLRLSNDLVWSCH